MIVIKGKNPNRFLNRIEFLLAVCIILGSAFVSLSIYWDSLRPSYYAMLPLLPFSYGITVIIVSLMNRNMLTQWYTLLPIGLYGIRNLVTPLIMRLGSYYGAFKQLTISNVSSGIYLMIYETFFVLVYLALSTKHWEEDRLNTQYLEVNRSAVYKLFITGLLLFCIAVWIFIPSVRNSYISLFSSEGLRVQLSNSSSLDAGTSQRSLGTLFQVILPITYMLFSTSIIVFANKCFKSKIIKTLFGLLAVMIPAFFMDGGDGNTFILMLALALTAFYIMGERSSAGFIKLFAIIAVGVVIYIFIQAMTNTFVYKSISLWENMSSMMQAYFPGVCNMAGVFNMGDYGKLSQLFYDLYSTIPFRNTLFGLSGFVRTPNLYTIDNNALSHIMPCVGHAFYYVSILAPILPCFLFKSAYKVYIKMRSTSDAYVYMAYVLLFIYLELTPIMYNIVIFGSHFLGTLLPLLIIAKLSCGVGRSINASEFVDHQNLR